MNPRHQRFIHAYLGEANGNGTKAAIAAGYSTKAAAETAHRLLRNPKIQRALERKLQKAGLTTDEALQNVSRIAERTAKVYTGSDILKANELILKVHGALRDKSGESRITVNIGFLTQPAANGHTVDVLPTEALAKTLVMPLAPHVTVIESDPEISG